jgi:hypothetical protein
VTAKLGAETVRARLVASHAWLVVLVAAGAIVASGLATPTRAASAVDEALLGVTLPLVVPVVCYALFELVHRRARTRDVLEPLARHGADRHALALGASSALACACALATALLACVTVLSALTAPAELVRELDACAWGGALTGAAYAGLLALGSLRGRAGRLWVLAADLIFGSGSGVFAVPWPRAHARNLLGGAAVLDASPGFSALVLALLAASLLVHSASRGPR